MNLPLTENARVWFSNDQKLRTTQKGRRTEVAEIYF